MLRVKRMMTSANMTLVDAGPSVMASFSALVSDDIFFVVARLVVAVCCVVFTWVTERMVGRDEFKETMCVYYSERLLQN